MSRRISPPSFLFGFGQVPAFVLFTSRAASVLVLPNRFRSLGAARFQFGLAFSGEFWFDRFHASHAVPAQTPLLHVLFAGNANT